MGFYLRLCDLVWSQPVFCPRKACEAESREPLLLGVSRELLRKRLRALRSGTAKSRCCTGSAEVFPNAASAACRTAAALSGPAMASVCPCPPTARRGRLWAAELWRECSEPSTFEAHVFPPGWVAGAAELHTAAQLHQDFQLLAPPGRASGDELVSVLKNPRLRRGRAWFGNVCRR